MRAVWAAAFLIRRLRHERGVVVLMLALVLLSAFLFAAGPRLLNQAADRALRHDLRVALPVERNLQLNTISIIRAGSDPLGAVQGLGERYLSELPASVRSLVRDSQLSITSARFAVADPPEYTTFITLRYQSGLQEAIQLTDGRLPASRGSQLPPAAFVLGSSDEPPVEQPQPAEFEIAVSAATAGEIGVGVGDVLDASLDGRDPLINRAFAFPIAARFTVVGIFEVADPDAEVWYGERALQTPSIGGSLENPIAFATALMAPDDYAGVVTTTLPMRYAWRYLVDPQRLDGGRLEGLIADLRRLETEYDTSPSDAAAEAGIVLRTGLLRLATDHLAQRAASEAVLSVAAVGPLALAGGAIGMTGIMLVSRRRPAIELSLARGASRRLLLGTQLWEALLLGLPPAVAGWLLAVALVPGRASPASAVLALAVGLLPAVALLPATWGAARHVVREAQRDAVAVRPPTARRLVLEGTAVVLAVAGVVLLRQRGLVISGEVPRFDPLLAATPVLAAAACGIVARRTYGLPVRALGWLASRRRDLVPVLGLREVARQPAAASLPLVVLMLTAAFSAFALVVTASLDRGQVDASWQQVGADYRLGSTRGGPFPASFDPGAVEGVEAVAPGLLDGTAGFSSQPNQRSSILLFVVDPAGQRAVSAGTVSEVSWPAALSGGSHAGTEEDPIPAIVSRRLPAGSRQLAPGDRFEVVVRGQPLVFEVAQERSTFPGIPPDGAFVIASYPQVREAYDGPTLLPSLFLVRAPAEAGKPMTEALRRQVADLLVTSRHARYAQLRDSPLVAAIHDGFAATMLVAAGYTAFAMVAALTLTAARRGREQALLRLMGLSPRQGLQLAFVEHAPQVLLALLPGLALGIGLAFLLAPGLGLAAFIGRDAAFMVHVDWWSIGGVSLALLGVVVLAVALASALARRVTAAQALRIGED